MKAHINKLIIIALILISSSVLLKAEDGQALWLRGNSNIKVTISSSVHSPVVDIAIAELKRGWRGKPDMVLNLRVSDNPAIKGDGFQLEESAISARTELGLLYGAYELLRSQYIGVSNRRLVSNPSYSRRILNHWDNLDGSVERGYAGRSIFWGEKENGLSVTEQDKAKWTAYARANASVGINGSVLNNVNASSKILSKPYLEKVKAIAEILRSYGIKTYLSVNFSSPVLIGKLKKADPLDPQVQQWWKDKVKEIFALIPDFGGFLVKANSEGQPGPQDYGRTHVDGANMMADALEPFGGIVMWRAFVYNPSPEDRTKQAYKEFIPLDGAFKKNVILQVKNGPLDFQPREPFSPLFGGMKKTPVMAEFQITQEYLGGSKQLVFISPLWEECLNSDTYQYGKGSTVAACTDGSLAHSDFTAIAGVSNIGTDLNWTGHTFAQANWYAFGRLAWNNKLESKVIAAEWIKQTFLDSKEEKTDTKFLKTVQEMMMESRDAAVDYMMPLGLHHIFAEGHHYGPAPWFSNDKIRADWTSVYYHKADEQGIGFDRTRSGSAAVDQYHEPLSSKLNNLSTCPEIYLLWFHHVPWSYRLKSGNDLWTELCLRYDRGVNKVRSFQKDWDRIGSAIDKERFQEVQSKLRTQSRDAQIWKDACLLYFQQFSKREIPFDIERPIHDLQSLKELTKSRDYN